MENKLKIFCSFLYVLIISSFVSAKVSPTYLFYLEETKTGCTWFMALPPLLKPVEVNKSRSCNKHILFSKLDPSMIYVDGQSIYKLDFKGTINSKKIADLPFEISDQDQFLFGDGNKIWIIKDVFLSDKLVITKDGKQFISYKNKLFLKKTHEYSSISELHEYDNNKWTMVDMQVNPGSDDAFQMVTAVLKNKKISKDFNSFADKIKLGQCCTGQSPELDKSTQDIISKLMGPSDGGAVDYDYKILNDKQSLVSKIIYGDTGHYMPPVYICEDECKSNKKFLISDFSQMGIHVNSEGYFLAGEEYSHAKTQVFNLKNVKPLKTFSNAVFATWLKQDYF